MGASLEADRLLAGAHRALDTLLPADAFIGDAQEDSEAVISELGAVRRLGRLPRLDPLTPDRLRRAFAENFNIADFLEVPA